ncbi:P-loop containing nucleoside triphosphate hydrolase protein [Entophlyctis helioformis]|nr:P-loop containing nucleoside triphosphate hydrolase protein [Entophlyctis helioformis]
MNRQRGHLGNKVAIHPIKRLKILSMGDPGCGKSCLIKRYCEGRFVPEYVTTIGIDYGVKTVKYDSEEVKVNFWDVGGDPVYFDIRNEFYKDTHGVMLVYDITSQAAYDNIEKWVAELRSYANTNVTLFLVANKTDLSPHAVTTSDGEAMAQKIGAKYFETSAVTGDGVADMFERLFLSASASQLQQATGMRAGAAGKRVSIIAPGANTATAQ